MPEAKLPLWQRRIFKFMELRDACLMEAEDAERYLRRHRKSTFAALWKRTQQEHWMDWLCDELGLLPPHTDVRKCWCEDVSPKWYRETCPAAVVEQALREAVPNA